MHTLSRRQFLSSAAILLGGTQIWSASAGEPDPIIDIHQHTTYSGRTHQQLRAHQKALGVTRTVLLPAGSQYGLDADCSGNQSVVELAERHPEEFLFFANEIPDLPGAKIEIEKYLKLGARGIGEQKFKVECDSQPIAMLAEIAQEFQAPVLLHFQHGTYNTHIERFHLLLRKYPKVNFIGHAQTWWGNIDRDHDQTVLYPATKVTPGGITDRLLTEHPNMYGDLSAGSGLNALLRDEDHARSFLKRHQNQLLFGTDCNDTMGRGPSCQGAQIMKALRRLVEDPAALRKIFYQNAARLLKIE